MPTETSDYDLGSTDLLGKFMLATMRANGGGAGGSSLVPNNTASQLLMEADYYKAVVLARMDGAKPPYQPGQKLRVKGDNSVSPRRLFEPRADPHKTYTVGWMLYCGKDQRGEACWAVGFREIAITNAWYDVDGFLAPSTPTT